MKRLVKLAWLALVLLVATTAFAQPFPDDRPARRAFSQAELDQMLAPIALYPDSLLSQILMASTYPRDLAEAASWSRYNSGMRGDTAVRAVEDRDWDPSVTSLVAFPEILAMMDERRDWVQRLADAYLEQPDQVMESIQHLRRRADEAGTLRSSEEIVIERRGDDYVIEPPSPEIVYVPYYDARVVYGSWWWPSYQPVWWRPWAGYWYRPGYRGYCWGPRVHVGSGFFYGSVDWRNRHLRYSMSRPWYVRHHHHWRDGHRWVRDDRRGDHRGRDGDRHRWRDGDRDRRRGDRGQSAPPSNEIRRSSDRLPLEQRDLRPRETRQPRDSRSSNDGFFAPQPQVQQPQRASAPLTTTAPRYPAAAPAAPVQREAPRPVVAQPAPVQAAPAEAVPLTRASAPRPQPVERERERPQPAERSAPAEPSSAPSSGLSRGSFGRGDRR